MIGIKITGWHLLLAIIVLSGYTYSCAPARSSRRRSSNPTPATTGNSWPIAWNPNHGHPRPIVVKRAVNDEPWINDELTGCYHSMKYCGKHKSAKCRGFTYCMVTPKCAGEKSVGLFCSKNNL